MRCEFEPHQEDSKRVKCNACGREMWREFDDMSLHVALDCGGAGPRKAKPKPAEAEALLPCIHRGEELRRAPCEVGCSPGRMLPVYQCTQRGECSATRIFKTQTLGRGLPLCTKCDQRKA